LARRTVKLARNWRFARRGCAKPIWPTDRTVARPGSHSRTLDARPLREVGRALPAPPPRRHPTGAAPSRRPRIALPLEAETLKNSTRSSTPTLAMPSLAACCRSTGLRLCPCPAHASGRPATARPDRGPLPSSASSSRPPLIPVVDTVRIEAATGMRRGRLLGAPLGPHPLLHRPRRSHQALTAVGHRREFSRLKTKTSRRNIVVDPATLTALPDCRHRNVADHSSATPCRVAGGRTGSVASRGVTDPVSRPPPISRQGVVLAVCSQSHSAARDRNSANTILPADVGTTPHAEASRSTISKPRPPTAKSAPSDTLGR
jgi:hypothetical protein